MAFSYMVSGARLPYCKGCSHGVVLRALGEALERLQWPPEDLAVVTDIGCVGLADAQFSTPHTIHTTHGRSTAFAAGLALAEQSLGRSRLKPIVMIGDGGATIGLGHLVSAALLNPDITVLVHNNFLFGMTGGQNSAFTPEEFVTSTTPTGNTTPPLDLAQLLMASRAPFVARKLATDRDLAEVIARAIEHPGFAVVEILELCTAYATRWNALTGGQLRQMADRAGYALGILRDDPRPTFGALHRQLAQHLPIEMQIGKDETGIPREFTARLEEPVGLVLAGTAGERVQTAATLLAHAAMRSRLQVTQKNDNPVTQGTGFSVSELLLSPEEILFTGIEQPDAVLVVSDDGTRELHNNGTWARVQTETLVLADAEVAVPELPCQILRFPFRSAAGPKLAALAGVACWLDLTGTFPLEAFWAAVDARFGGEAEGVKAKLSRFVGVA